MNKVDNQKINQLTDLLDYASMIYFDEKESTYLECLSKVLESYMEEEDLPFDEEVLEKLNSVFVEIDKLELSIEELRRVFLLLSIKGFKHANFSLDLITPDAVSLIVNYLVDSLIKTVDKPKDIVKKFARPIKGKYQVLEDVFDFKVTDEIQSDIQKWLEAEYNKEKWVIYNEEL